jgi:hypothetical protein
MSWRRVSGGTIHTWRGKGVLLRILRRGVRERLLRLPPLERGTTWDSSQGGAFFHTFQPWELEEEARECGYKVEYFERTHGIYPHAVLVPSLERGR